MKYQEHCERCMTKLGKPYYVVHRWMDEFSKVDLTNHRRARHHSEGIAEVKRMWGEDAEAAAIMHVMDDCGFIPNEKWYDENWIENKND